MTGSSQDGDVILTATDGLFDNIQIVQIIDVLNQICRPSVNPTRGVSKVPLLPPNDVAERLNEVSQIEIK